MLTKDRPINEYPEVLDARMIATIMGIGYVKALHTIKYGGINYLKLGNTYRVARSSFITWLEREGQHHVLS